MSIEYVTCNCYFVSATVVSCGKVGLSKMFFVFFAKIEYRKFQHETFNLRLESYKNVHK